MSTEPKRVELTEAERNLAAWFHGEFHPCMHPNGSANQCEAWAEQFARTAGWVSPEEAAALEAAAEQRGREDNALHDMCYVSGSKALEAREAAARREALLEAATEFEEDAADAWGGNAPWMTSGVRVANLAAEWLRESAAALAEPERDEEGGR